MSEGGGEEGNREPVKLLPFVVPIQKNLELSVYIILLPKSFILVSCMESPTSYLSKKPCFRPHRAMLFVSDEIGNHS